MSASTSARPTPARAGDAPAVVVMDLDAPGAFDALVELRGRWPETLVAGHIGLPDRDRWLAAERAGCDLVANRGALAAALRKRVSTGAPRRGRRVPLFALADAAGRLGCVHKEAAGGAVDEALAVYHVGSGFHACADRCPHAGATLSEGELEGPVVTCPRHGSQFDVTTGHAPGARPTPTSPPTPPSRTVGSSTCSSPTPPVGDDRRSSSRASEALPCAR